MQGLLVGSAFGRLQGICQSDGEEEVEKLARDFEFSPYSAEQRMNMADDLLYQVKNTTRNDIRFLTWRAEKSIRYWSSKRSLGTLSHLEK